MLVGGRYETLRELGRGGSGKSYLAEDTYRRGNPKCVVKRIKPQSKLPSILQKARSLFEAEVAALYELGRHDQIPKLYEHLEQNGEFFLVQEMIDGHDLRQSFVVGDRWDEKALVSLLREVLEILDVVHQHQVIHQDINPQNLLRRWRDKKLVLIDFSGVKAIRSLMVNAQGETIITQPIGTPGYMAPEQVEGKPQLCSDIYALGMICIQAVTGYMPKQLPRNPKTQEVEWHDQAQLTPELVAILDKMVSVDPSQRYQSAAEVLADLPASATAKITSTILEDRVEAPKPLRYGLVITPQFAVAKDFSEELAAVVVEQKLGYINPAGQFVIQPELAFNLVSSFREGAYQFSQGLAPLAIAHKWGYVDRTGKLVIKPQFDSAESFFGGLARVEQEHRYGYIDSSGEFAIPPWFESAAPSFSEDLAGVEIGHQYGYIDKTGRVVIEPQFDSADEFAEGLARVTLNDKYGFIDKTGKLVIPAEFDVAHTFKEGLARVRISDRYGYINQSGKLVIQAQFDDTFSFTEGLALVRNNETYGFIDTTGAMVLPLQFEDAYPFAEGLAAVKVDGRWGYINKTGEFVMEPQFEDARSFHNERAAVKLDTLWGYLGVEK
ncbi:MAG TPA: WG repeat-containing protein [Crinalium sp.]|jgi:serine/threonine-protein kinase